MCSNSHRYFPLNMKTETMTLRVKFLVCMYMLFSSTRGDDWDCNEELLTYQHGTFVSSDSADSTGFRIECKHTGLTSVTMPKNDMDLHLNDISEPSHFTRIKSLDFSGNQIDLISALNFSFAPSVIDISFAQNHIKHIPDSLFSTFKNLKKVNLSSNFITDKDLSYDNIFSNIPSYITELDLSSNSIKVIKEMKIFSLEKLHLSHCSISAIREEAFDGMSNLEYIDLSNNQIADFDFMLMGLLHLDLSNNILTAPPQPNHNIQTLLLSNNRIASIQKHAFSNMVDLVTMSLAYNKLTYITNTSLPLHRFQVLRLEGNPWDCCKLRWMTSSKIKTLNEKKHFTLPCKDPPELENHDMFTVTEDQLSCNTVSRHTLLLAMLCVALACFLVTGVGFVLYRKRRKLRRFAARTVGKNDDSGKYIAVYSQDICEESAGKVAISDQKPLVNMANNTPTMIDV